MRFIRFVLARRHPESGVDDGTFSLAYELRDSPQVEAPYRDLLAENLAWFEKNLETHAVQPNEIEGFLSPKESRNCLVQGHRDRASGSYA
jgi:hypothetical protein